MAVKAFDNRKDKFVKIASLQSEDIIVNKEDFVSDNVDDALSELKLKLDKLKSNIAWIYENGTIGGGGGEGGDTSTGTIIVDNFDKDNNLILQDGESAKIVFKVASKLTTAFNIKIQVGQKLTKTLTVNPNVTTTVTLGTLSEGTYDVTISGTDYTGYPLENWKGYIVSGIISITSTFNSDLLYDINAVVTVGYTVKVADALTSRPLTVRYSVDSQEEVVIENAEPNVAKSIVINQEQENMTLGEHLVVITASIPDSTGINEITATKTIPFQVMSNKAIAVYVPDGTSTNYQLGTTVRIPFKIVANYNLFNVFDITAKIYKADNVSEGSEIDTIKLPNTSYSGNKTVHIDTSQGTQYYTNGTADYAMILSGYATADPSIVSVNDQTFYFTLSDSEGDFTPWSVEQNNLIAYFSALNEVPGQTSAWPNKIANSDITCELVGCNGTSTGFVTESDGSVQVSPDTSGILKLYGESYARIHYQPFDAQKTNENTISIIYKFESNGISNSTILSCSGFTQQSATMEEGIWINQDKINYRYSQQTIETYNVEDEWIHCDIVTEHIAEDNQKLLKIYINGVLTACDDVGSIASHTNDIGDIYIGCRHYQATESGEFVDILDNYSDVKVKSVKIYDRALTSEEVVANYIADDYYMHANEDGTNYDSIKNLELRRLNSFDDNKKFSEGGNGCGLPTVRISFNSKENRDLFNTLTNSIENDPSQTSIQVECNIQYSNYDNTVIFDTASYAGQMTGSYIKLQGTTSLTYNRKNYDIGFGNWTTGNDSGKQVMFTPKYGDSRDSDQDKNWLPENVFTLKCDLMDSSHANNVGSANVVSEVYSELGLTLPPMINTQDPNHLDIKYAIEGFPCMLYIQDGTDEDNPDSYVFYGIYMFDLGRSTYYNLGLQNYTFELDTAQGTIPCLARNVADTTTNPDQIFAYEADSNDREDAGSFAQIDKDLVKAKWVQRYPTVASENGYDALVNAINNVVFATGKPIYKLNESGVSTGEIAQANPGGMDGVFRDTNIWNKSHTIVYLILAYALGMVDSLGKNLVVKSWNATASTDDVWYPTFYDMDTILGLDNTGGITWKPSVDLDAFVPDDSAQGGGAALQRLTFTPSEQINAKLSYGASNGEGRGKGGYNSSTSRLWDAIRMLYYESSKDSDGNFTIDTNSFIGLYLTLRQKDKPLHWESLFNNYKKIIDKIGQIYYNKDAEIKYIPKYTTADNSGEYRQNLKFLHGTRELFTKRWLKQRLYYLDSRFMASLAYDGYYAKLLSNRVDFTGSETSYNVKTISPVFVDVKLDNSAQGDNARLCDTTYYTNMPFTVAANNVQVNLNNAPLLQYVNGLNDAPITDIELADASNLINLDLSNAIRLSSIVVRSCKSLRYFNIQGCTGLNQSSVDLSQCNNLQEIDISNTKLTNIILPTTGTLKMLTAANSSIVELKLENQYFLEEVDLTNCQYLTSLTIFNCQNLKKLIVTDSSLTSIVISDCPNLEIINAQENQNLKSVSFTSCENIKELDFSYCNTNVFAQYTGDDDTDYLNGLNLTGCPNLEKLSLVGCSAQVVKFNSNLTSLKQLDATNGQLMKTIYVGTFYDEDGHLQDSTREFNTYKDKPAVDLSRFTDMNVVKFTSNKYIQCVTGFKRNWNLSTYRMFYGCTKLYRITGELTIKDNYRDESNELITLSNGEEFAQMTTYQVVSDGVTSNVYNDFRLNDWGSTVTSSNFTTAATTFKLYIECANLNSTFSYNYGINMNDVRYVCYSANSVKTLNSTFQRSQPAATRKTDVATTQVPDDLFSKLTNLTSCQATFYGCGLSGQFPANIFSMCANLSNCSNIFAFNGFTILTKDFENVFDGPKQSLTNCSNMLCTNSALSTNNIVLDPTKFFYNCSNLTNCNNFLGCTGSYDTTEDYYTDNYKQRKILLSSSNTERIFSRCPKLTNCSGAFAQCTFQGQLSPNVFGGEQSSMSGSWSDGVAYNYPTGLTDVSFCFFNSGITMEMNSNIFAKQTSIANISGCFAKNTNVTGDISTLSSIFSNNIELTHARRFFESTGVTGVIESSSNTVCPLFRNNTKLIDAKKLFKNSKITGTLPHLLFGSCNNLSNIDEIFYGCTGLNGEIPNDLFHVKDSTGVIVIPCSTAKNTLYGCNNLVSQIPSDLFKSLTKVSNVSGFFRGCGSKTNTAKGIIGNIPSDLLSKLTSLTDVSYLFNGCWGITPIVNDDATYTTVSGDFLQYNTLITTVQGMFGNMKLHTIPATLFNTLSLLTDISYLFSGSDRTEMVIYNTMFNKNSLINNAKCFMGEESSDAIVMSYNDNGSSSLNGLFKEYDVNLATGQKALTNVSYAFKNNPNMTGTIPAKFWEWSKQPTVYTQCYAKTGFSNVAAGYGE